MSSIKYRPIDYSELDFQKEMLYQALYVPEGNPKYSRAILDEPPLCNYIDEWGKYTGDICIVAESDNVLVGAIWGRIFSSPKIGYGYVNDKTPEISVAIISNYRSRGIGTRLINEICQAYKKKGIESISLSVDCRSPAHQLYIRCGFKTIKEDDLSVIMTKKLN